MHTNYIITKYYLSKLTTLKVISDYDQTCKYMFITPVTELHIKKHNLFTIKQKHKVTLCSINYAPG